jgi:ribosomal protein S18 acetylase RimI-like enzyme
MLSELITQEQIFIPDARRPRVFSAVGTDREAAVAVVTLGFSTDPIARWVYPEPADYLALFPSFIRAFAGAAFEANTALLTNDYLGAALWLPPGSHADEDAINSLVAETVRPSIQADLATLFEEMAAHHPDRPHWYLPMIAADTFRQGRGTGTALMEYAVERCDDDNLPAYLESSNPRNMSLYARFGFKVIGQIQAGSAPAMFPMLREPRG